MKIRCIRGARRGPVSKSILLSAVFFGGTTILSGNALAQARPDEQEMFGGDPAPAESSTQARAQIPAGSASPPAPTSPTASTPPPSAEASTGSDTATQLPSKTPTNGNAASAGVVTSVGQTGGKESARDAAILGSNEQPMFTEDAAPEDPLKIGGQLYLRTQTTGAQGQRLQNFSLSSPSLLDIYLDARPNDRVRGFVLSRLSYDPTLPASAASGTANGSLQATGSTSGSQSLSSVFQSATRGPNYTLDQLWLRFDVGHTAFLTVGKQHVRWGTGRFWAPTDFLHLRKRNPLDVFDARAGTTMVKVHLPIESKAWNFYGYAITESNTSTPRLGNIAGAARAEFVLGTTELALGAIASQDQKPKYAADISTGIGDFDIYGEIALRQGSTVDRVRYSPNATLPTAPNPPTWQTPQDTDLARLQQTVDAYYPVFQSRGIKPQAVAGVNYSRKYNDNDTFTIGSEYFYNSLGYASPEAYPGLVLPHSTSLNDPATFFYLGRHYASVFITFPAPYSLDNHTFTLSTLANVSDQSYITRFDYSLIALTHLRFEAFASARYGNENGEFRFGVKRLDLGGVSFSRAAAMMDLGVAVRVAL